MFSMQCRSLVARAVSLAPSRAAFFGTAAATRDEASADTTPPWKNTFAAKPSSNERQGLKKERKENRELEIDARWNKCALFVLFSHCIWCVVRFYGIFTCRPVQSLY